MTTHDINHQTISNFDLKLYNEKHHIVPGAFADYRLTLVFETADNEAKKREIAQMIQDQNDYGFVIENKGRW